MSIGISLAANVASNESDPVTVCVCVCVVGKKKTVQHGLHCSESIKTKRLLDRYSTLPVSIRN